MTSPQPWKQHEFVFVAGMHRSGTTLLADVVASSDAASGLTETGVTMDEGQFLQDVYPIGKVMGGPTRWAFDQRAYLTDADAAKVPDAAARLWASWSPYWNLDAHHLVEKTPLNLTKTRFLQAVYPDSKFVVITRHPITQALAVRKWSGSAVRKSGHGFSDLIDMWVRAHEAFRRDCASLRHVHVVRFEELVADPDAEVSRLQEFVGFPVNAEAGRRFDAARARAYVQTWRDTVESGGVARAAATVARTDLRSRAGIKTSVRRAIEQVVFPRQARQLPKQYGARVRALGYDLRDVDYLSPWLPDH